MNVNDFPLILFCVSSMLAFRLSFQTCRIFVYDIISCAVFAQTIRRSFYEECSKASAHNYRSRFTAEQLFSFYLLFLTCVNVLCKTCILCHFGVNSISKLITYWSVSWCWHSSLSVSVKKRALRYLKGFVRVLRTFLKKLCFLIL